MKFFILILQRYLTNTKKYHPEKLLETLSLFFQPEFPEKDRVLVKLARPCVILLNAKRDHAKRLFNSLFPCSGFENRFRFSKTFVVIFFAGY